MKKKIIISDEKIIKYYGKPIKVRMYGHEGNQYQQFYSNKEKKWMFSHIRAAQKKYFSGENIPKDFQVHHIDKDRENNKKENLILLHVKDHRELHNKKTLEIKRK
jgi:hypothetical protein